MGPPWETKRFQLALPACICMSGSATYLFHNPLLRRPFVTNLTMLPHDLESGSQPSAYRSPYPTAYVQKQCEAALPSFALQLLSRAAGIRKPTVHKNKQPGGHTLGMVRAAGQHLIFAPPPEDSSAQQCSAWGPLATQLAEKCITCWMTYSQI